MPLLKGKKNISRNISELVHSLPSVRRARGIKTLSNKLGISLGAAKRRQAIAIASNYAGRNKKSG